ncbi:uncharacterized protein BXZ73DRAFT_101357 [Epithele typhae]|uniref:uncharacterized protein n=1 Tax=Epithele typhae TaxID=378194 RepID=UPI0020081EB7|nr:uncharacterized protein BXZ73DRAFT_101357 [Epithele typhae]KAH9932821.1 hypothetical protein BXZ73DRAFT_101357 [Epithele typhae]
MAFPPDACRLIVENVSSSRSTLLSLCTVSKQFQMAAEKVIYNTLSLSGYEITSTVCTILAHAPRLAMLVVALSISGQDSSSDDEAAEDEDPAELPDDFWESLHSALRHTTRLRFLNLHFQGGTQTDKSWILQNVTFQLKKFHCDLTWDDQLAHFLSTQKRLCDLFLADFVDPPSTTPQQASGATTSDPPRPSLPSPSHASFLPKLSILECTFSEAALALVPERPLTRLKTCFTHSKPDEKRVELRALLAALRRSRRRPRALDIADSAYTPAFALELLAALTAGPTLCADLRYCGALVLPVDGRQRLEFYGLLMRLPQLRCVEVDVSEWEPAPVHAAALRALACELRLYCPSVTGVVFVYEFERHLVRVAENGMVVYDEDAATDALWRDS